jgi:hypothetical protein
MRADARELALQRLLILAFSQEHCDDARDKTKHTKTQRRCHTVVALFSFSGMSRSTFQNVDVPKLPQNGVKTHTASVQRVK